MSQYNKLDYLLPMALSQEADALIDIKGGVVTTNFNSSQKVFEGFYFNGANRYLDSNFNIKDANNYQIDDAQMECFIFSGEVTQSNKQIFGCSDATSRVFLSYQSSPRALITIHDAGFLIVNTFPFKQLHVIARDGVTKLAYRNGINVGSNTNAINGIPDQNFGLGALISNGAGINHWEGVISIASFGATAGVNQAAKSDIYEEFLTNLGVLP